MEISYNRDKYLSEFSVKTLNDRYMIEGENSPQDAFARAAKAFADSVAKGEIKVKHEDAKVLAHPECEENILEYADFIGSTSALIKNVNETNDEKYIIATEPGVIHQMQKHNPDKKFIPLPANNGCACNECPHMRLNTIEKIIDVLSNLKNEITVAENIRVKALKPINRMLEIV